MSSPLLVFQLKTTNSCFIDSLFWYFMVHYALCCFIISIHWDLTDTVTGSCMDVHTNTYFLGGYKGMEIFFLFFFFFLKKRRRRKKSLILLKTHKSYWSHHLQWAVHWPIYLFSQMVLYISIITLNDLFWIIFSD